MFLVVSDLVLYFPITFPNRPPQCPVQMWYQSLFGNMISEDPMKLISR